jgi:hypothetical protein
MLVLRLIIFSIDHVILLDPGFTCPMFTERKMRFCRGCGKTAFGVTFLR